MRRAPRRNGHRVPLYVNLIVDTKGKRTDSGFTGRVRVLGGGGLSVTRYPASIRG
jgi:hypothetical protein